MKRALVCILILLSALSCQRVEVDCIYTVRVFVQERKGGERIPLEDVKVYAFAADTSRWTVANIDDARAGVITSRENPGERLSDPEVAVKVFDTEEGGSTFNGKNRFERPFTQQGMMLVVAHGTQDIFAYGNAQIQLNLPRMEVTLVFDLSRTDTEPYNQGLWEIHNEGVESPVRCFYSVSSRQKRVEGPTISPVTLGSARLHVFYLSEEDGNIPDWEVASYEDAVEGILTNTVTSARKEAVPAEIDYGSGTATAYLTQGRAVLAVYDTIQPMYAYAPANLADNPDKRSEEVVFYPYRPNTVTESGDGRWAVIMGDTRVTTLLTVSPAQKFSDMVADSAAEPLTTAKGYAFYADTTEWNILSYEDALTGTITAREGAATRTADLEGSVAKYGMRISFAMTQTEDRDKVLVVVYDTMQPMYAVAVIEPGKTNWPETMQQGVVFSPYRPNETFLSGIWEIRNGDTAVPMGN